MAQPIVNEVRQETLDLMVEVFATTPGATWEDAARIALRDVAGLLSYAREWDAATPAHSRMLLLMDESGCSEALAAQAVEQARVAA